MGPRRSLDGVERGLGRCLHARATAQRLQSIQVGAAAMSTASTSGNGEIELALESPRSASVRELIDESEAYQRTLYPPENGFLPGLETLAGHDIRFLVARRDGVAVGCGALRVDPAGHGELERIFVAQTARGLRIGTRILRRLEEQARQEGLTLLRLEMVVPQPEAIALCRAGGYVERARSVGNGDQQSALFMEKRL
jgi:putative acetyltransferase